MGMNSTDKESQAVVRERAGAVPEKQIVPLARRLQGSSSAFAWKQSGPAMLHCQTTVFIASMWPSLGCSSFKAIPCDVFHSSMEAHRRAALNDMLVMVFVSAAA